MNTNTTITFAHTFVKEEDGVNFFRLEVKNNLGQFVAFELGGWDMMSASTVCSILAVAHARGQKSWEDFVAHGHLEHITSDLGRGVFDHQEGRDEWLNAQQESLAIWCLLGFPDDVPTALASALGVQVPVIW